YPRGRRWAYKGWPSEPVRAWRRSRRRASWLRARGEPGSRRRLSTSSGAIAVCFEESWDPLLHSLTCNCTRLVPKRHTEDDRADQRVRAILLPLELAHDLVYRARIRRAQSPAEGIAHQLGGELPKE